MSNKGEAHVVVADCIALRHLIDADKLISEES